MILLGFSTGSMFSGNAFACSACFICLFSSSVAWFNWSIPNFPEESFIHPAATGCLTEAVQSAMIGIDVLLPVKVRPMGSKKHPQQSTPPTKKTPTFLLELPLAVQAGEAAPLPRPLEGR